MSVKNSVKYLVQSVKFLFFLCVFFIEMKSNILHLVAVRIVVLLMSESEDEGDIFAFSGIDLYSPLIDQSSRMVMILRTAKDQEKTPSVTGGPGSNISLN